MDGLPILFGQVFFGGYSILQLFAFVIVFAAGAAIVAVILRKFGVAIDADFIKIFWIVVCAIVGIFALYFLAGFIGRL